MTQGASSGSARRWRDKYLNLVDSHEKLKYSTEHQQDQLRRGLVMSSLLAQGQTTAVDKALHALREALKPGAHNDRALDKSLDQLQRSLQQFEAQNSAQAEVLIGQLHDAADKLGQCPLPRKLLKRVKGVRKQAENDLQSWSGYSTQLQQWMQILGELATLEGFDEPRPKWWQRWFQPSTDTDANAAANTSNDSDHDDLDSDDDGADGFDKEKQNDGQAPALPSGERVELADDDADKTPEPGFSHIAQEVAETLLHLLSKLVIPENLLTTAHQLQERLAHGLNWYELVPLLEDVAEFLIACLGNGQQEFERFLQTLDERLQAIQSLVSDSSEGQQEREVARKELDTLVRDQVDDIRSVVTGSEDLGLLGANVTAHLGLIVDAMDHYQREESAREQRLMDQLGQLQQRLENMEQESLQARKVIEEQKRRATHDALTGLPNRDAYQQRLADEMKRRSRYGGALSMIVADVDHFKRINDSYGHLAGDKVLQLLAKTMRANLRDVDFVARYGGEEFVILLPECDAAAAFDTAEKLRQKIAHSPFNFKKERVPITMSFGVGEFHSGEDAEVVFERADKALYQAKDLGRNRTCVAQSDQQAQAAAVANPS